MNERDFMIKGCRAATADRHTKKRARHVVPVNQIKMSDVLTYCNCRTWITRTQLFRISFGQCLDQLRMKIIVTSCNRRRDAFFVHLPGTLDVFAQSFVNVALSSAFVDLLFVV